MNTIMYQFMPDEIAQGLHIGSDLNHYLVRDLWLGPKVPEISKVYFAFKKKTLTDKQVHPGLSEKNHISHTLAIMYE